MHDLVAREFAIEVRDLLLMRPPGNGFELSRNTDRLLPVLFLLVDLQQIFERSFRVYRIFEFGEQLFGTVEKPCLEIVLSQLE